MVSPGVLLAFLFFSTHLKAETKIQRSPFPRGQKEVYLHVQESPLLPLHQTTPSLVTGPCVRDIGGHINHCLPTTVQTMKRKLQFSTSPLTGHSPAPSEVMTPASQQEEAHYLGEPLKHTSETSD